MEILGIESVLTAPGAYNVTMTVKIMKNGMPFIDADGLGLLQQKRFYVSGYDSETGTYPEALTNGLSNPVAVVGQPGGIYSNGYRCFLCA